MTFFDSSTAVPLTQSSTPVLNGQESPSVKAPEFTPEDICLEPATPPENPIYGFEIYHYYVVFTNKDVRVDWGTLSLHFGGSWCFLTPDERNLQHEGPWSDEVDWLGEPTDLADIKQNLADYLNASVQPQAVQQQQARPVRGSHLAQSILADKQADASNGQETPVVQSPSVAVNQPVAVLTEDEIGRIYRYISAEMERKDYDRLIDKVKSLNEVHAKLTKELDWAKQMMLKYINDNDRYGLYMYYMGMCRACLVGLGNDVIAADEMIAGWQREAVGV